MMPETPRKTAERGMLTDRASTDIVSEGGGLMLFAVIKMRGADAIVEPSKR